MVEFQRVNPTAEQRRYVWQRDRGKCRYCGCGLLGQPMHIDHVVPVALGGRTLLSNLVLACRDCNLRKGARVWTPTPVDAEWRPMNLSYRRKPEVHNPPSVKRKPGHAVSVFDDAQAEVVEHQKALKLARSLPPKEQKRRKAAQEEAARGQRRALRRKSAELEEARRRALKSGVLKSSP